MQIFFFLASQMIPTSPQALVSRPPFMRHFALGLTKLFMREGTSGVVGFVEMARGRCSSGCVRGLSQRAPVPQPGGAWMSNSHALTPPHLGSLCPRSPPGARFLSGGLVGFPDQCLVLIEEFCGDFVPGGKLFSQPLRPREGCQT